MEFFLSYGTKGSKTRLGIPFVEQCKKGDKCKFSHDDVENKSEKKSIYVDLRDEDSREEGKSSSGTGQEKVEFKAGHHIDLQNCDSYLELTAETLILQANVGLTLLPNLHEVNRRKANLYEEEGKFPEAAD
ncbi:uncharacterized protein LOC143248132 [Tachypleus tridentatus]|uniref:uncharacterized protein LOC143248132 n=1 Tax=Tachypleus tridentatus TaxID=6853 RepID=UPI003FD1767A